MHRYTQEELQSIFQDQKLGEEIIPHIKNNKIDAVLWDQRYKQQWKQIQQQLKKGLLCPVCGTILFKFYEKHLAQHSLNIQQVYNQAHDIKKCPRCPICGKEVEFIKNKWYYRKFCCVQHQIRYIDKETGLKFGWSEDEIDEHNNRIRITTQNNAININLKYGSQFSTELSFEQRQNRGLLDDDKYAHWQLIQKEKKSVAGKKGAERVHELLYGCHAKSVGYTSTVNISESRQFTLDSQQELFHLLKRVFIDKDDVSKFRNKIFLKNHTQEFDGHSAYTDLVVIDGDTKTNYEVHNSKDIEGIERKKYCSMINGYDFVFEDISLYTYPNGKYVQILKQFIDVDNLYSKLTQAHYNHEKFIFDLYKYI